MSKIKTSEVKNDFCLFQLDRSVRDASACLAADHLSDFASVNVRTLLRPKLGPDGSRPNRIENCSKYRFATFSEFQI